MKTIAELKKVANSARPRFTSKDVLGLIETIETQKHVMHEIFEVCSVVRSEYGPDREITKRASTLQGKIVHLDKGAK